MKQPIQKQINNSINLNHQQNVNNEYICFSPECNCDELTNISERKCKILHPEYILTSKTIEFQLNLLNKSVKVNEQDQLMGILYRTILQIQEAQSFIEALHFIPTLTQEDVEYQQKKFSKLKNFFQFNQIQDKTLLYLKNQTQLINSIDKSISKAKDYINGFQGFFAKIKSDYNEQITFLKFGSELSKIHQNNESSKCIQIEDDDESVEINEEKNDQKYLNYQNSHFQMINTQKQIINQCVQNNLNNLKYETYPNPCIELISSEEESECQLVQNKTQKGVTFNDVVFNVLKEDDCVQPKQKMQKQIIKNQNQKLRDEDYDDFELMQTQSNINDSDYDGEEDEQDKKIIKKKKIQKSINKSQQKKLIKEAKQKIKEEKKQLKEEKLKQKEAKLQQKNKQIQNKKKDQIQQVKKNQQLISLNQDDLPPTFAKRCLPLEVPKTDEEGYQQNQIESVKQMPPVIDENLINSNSGQNNSLKIPCLNNSDSTTSTNQDKIIEEDDDDCEEELQIIQKQNGQIEKLLITNFTWPRQSQNQNKLPNMILSGRSSIQSEAPMQSSNENYIQRDISDDSSSNKLKQMNQINQEKENYNQINIIEDESEPQNISNRFNYYSQSKFIHYNQKSGLLLLNQKNVVLYTRQKPKVRKSRFDGLFDNDSDNENENQEQNCDSNQDKKQNINNKELYQKKILFSNIKSAELFEVFSSYYVLIMLETNGSIVIVKSNNYHKWKPYYRYGEPSTYQCSHIFNNSSILYIQSFNTSHIKLFSIDLSASKPNPKQLVSKLLQHNLTEGQFMTSCQGFWQIIKNSNQQVLVQNEIYFFIAYENQITLFKTDMTKIEQIAQEDIANINSCKILNLCGQVSLVVLQDKQVLIYNQLLKLTTKIQANPNFGDIVDCFLPQDQSLSEISLIIVQEYCTFSYNCVKNKARLFKTPEKYNIAFFDQNQSKLMSLFESSNSKVEVDFILSNQ